MNLRSTQSFARSSWQEIFPAFDVPEWFDLNCVDVSSLQDATPCFIWRAKYEILVDAADPKFSEHQIDRGTGDQKRYIVFGAGEYGHALPAKFQADTLGELTDWLNQNA